MPDLPAVTAATMTIGRRSYPVASLAEASAMFIAARDRAGTGGRDTPTPLLFDREGRQIAYVSYNGRVWAGTPRDWKPGHRPLVDPILPVAS